MQEWNQIWQGEYSVKWMDYDTHSGMVIWLLMKSGVGPSILILVVGYALSFEWNEQFMLIELDCEAIQLLVVVVYCGGNVEWRCIPCQSGMIIPLFGGEMIIPLERYLLLLFVIPNLSMGMRGYMDASIPVNSFMPNVGLGSNDESFSGCRTISSLHSLLGVWQETGVDSFHPYV